MDEQQWESILSFWFDGDVKDNYKRKWFPTSGAGDNPQVVIDRHITEHFSELLHAAERGELESWGATSARSVTALVVLLDQFSRHIYRHVEGREQVKINDVRALKHAEAALELGWDTALPVPYQAMHSLFLPPRSRSSVNPSSMSLSQGAVASPTDQEDGAYSGMSFRRQPQKGSAAGEELGLDILAEDPAHRRGRRQTLQSLGEEHFSMSRADSRLPLAFHDVKG
ncbi:hypothetical protein CYMTET_17790 [Cymbomonas tetramitiformis]|uniref:Uncharacterized protein n=1 Tax=Cymbomonas tetramitiformis TaxID=36881 RepID=A0AAE0G9D3_9CHLO|nr:hypothetical protein CYMTET_17790 [Cymbomonas tetramitiformis]